MPPIFYSLIFIKVQNQTNFVNIKIDRFNFLEKSSTVHIFIIQDSGQVTLNQGRIDGSQIK